MAQGWRLRYDFRKDRPPIVRLLRLVIEYHSWFVPREDVEGRDGPGGHASVVGNVVEVVAHGAAGVPHVSG